MAGRLVLGVGGLEPCGAFACLHHEFAGGARAQSALTPPDEVRHHNTPVGITHLCIRELRWKCMLQVVEQFLHHHKAYTLDTE
jgi:hypothetical protein